MSKSSAPCQVQTSLIYKCHSRLLIFFFSHRLSCICRRLFFHINFFLFLFLLLWGATVRTAGLSRVVAAGNGLPWSDWITRSLAPSALFFIFAFYFHRRCEWSVALGITDMTRDTLLLEFSQVRATPIEEPRVPLCLPSHAKRRGDGKPCALSPFFCCPFNLSKKEMDSKELNKEDMKMSRAKRERERGGSFPFPPSETRTNRRILLNG